jgi:hypothetical protein
MAMLIVLLTTSYRKCGEAYCRTKRINSNKTGKVQAKIRYLSHSLLERGLHKQQMPKPIEGTMMRNGKTNK